MTLGAVWLARRAQAWHRRLVQRWLPELSGLLGRDIDETFEALMNDAASKGLAAVIRGCVREILDLRATARTTHRTPTELRRVPREVARLDRRRDATLMQEWRDDVVNETRRAVPLLEDFHHDLTYGLRALMRAKGWTVVVLLSLALGIGANVTLFSAVNGLLLKTISVRDPETLVRFRAAGPNEMVTNSMGYGSLPKETRATFSYPMFQQLIGANQTMTDVIACAPFGRMRVVIDGQAEIASAFISTGNYYRVLGITTSLGRPLTPDDDLPTAPPAAVISHRYWVSRFGSDLHAVGQTVHLNGVPVTIVGVTSSDYSGIQQAAGTPPDFSIPLALDTQLTPGPSRLSQPTYWWLQIIGRVKPGVTPALVQANLDAVFRNAARDGLNTYLKSLSEHDRSRPNNANRSQVPQLQIQWGRHGIYDANPNDVRAVTTLSGVVVLVLLIVCANVANLLLSRATIRRREIAVRLSMGATRARLIRQMLTESVLLAALGGTVGIALAYWGQPLLPGPAGQVTPLNWTVLGFLLAVTLLTGVAFGLAPALRATRVDLAAMKEQSRSVVGSRSFVGKALVIVQVAVSLVLLIGAGLFLRTVQNLRQVDVGFNPHNLVVFRVNPQLNRYDETRIFGLYAEMLDRIGTLPGVRSAALSQPGLLSGNNSSTSIFVQGRANPTGTSRAQAGTPEAPR
jgi:predicted permease